MQCQKINPNFRVLTCNVEENEKLHKIFRVVLRFSATFHVISRKIYYLWDSVSEEKISIMCSKCKSNSIQNFISWWKRMYIILNLIYRICFKIIYCRSVPKLSGSASKWSGLASKLSGSASKLSGSASKWSGLASKWPGSATLVRCRTHCIRKY